MLMKTGDIVTDSRARAWTLGALLGEGIWGRTWLVRDEEGRQRALKVPYEAAELPPASADRAATMRACAEEMAERASSGEPHLAPLEDRITLPTGSIALLFPYMPTTLNRQLQSGIPLSEALSELLAVVELLEKARGPHGNLRPSNILVDPHGAPVFTDVATPSCSTLLAAGARSTPGRRRWVPPDHVAADTWAVCQALYAAVLLDEPSGRDGANALPPAPMEGLDKVARAGLKDHAIARLKRDGANTRFVARAAERLVAVLARGLSKETDPSPPYRFLRPADLRPRLAEVVALIHPRVESVGKLLLTSSAAGDVFSGPGPVGFTVSVATSDGLTEPEDLVCGVRLTDLDAEGDGRIPLDNAQFAVNRHPSGRMRFEFNLPDIAPGRYGVRVAFSVKDSGDEPVVAEGSFEVRPPPGYVPPPRQDGPATLSFPGRAADGPDPSAVRSHGPALLTPFASSLGGGDEDEDDEDNPTVLMPTASLDPDSDPGGELIDAFPRPLAPSSPGSGFARGSGIAPLHDEPSVPPSAPVMPRPSLAAVPTPPPSDPGVTDPSSVPAEPWAPTQAPEAPSVVQARPSVTVSAPPPTSGAPFVPPAPRPLPVPQVAPRPPAPQPAPLPTEQPWEASQVDEADFFGSESALPGAGGTDLLPEGGSSPTAFDTARSRFMELVQRDSPTAIGAAVAGCFLLLVIAMVLARSC